jgi:hypothetical protein
MFLQLLDDFRITLELFRKIRRGDSNKAEQNVLTASVKNLRYACIGAAEDFKTKFAMLFNDYVTVPPVLGSKRFKDYDTLSTEVKKLKVEVS